MRADWDANIELAFFSSPCLLTTSTACAALY